MEICAPPRASGKNLNCVVNRSRAIFDRRSALDACSVHSRCIGSRHLVVEEHGGIHLLPLEQAILDTPDLLGKTRDCAFRYRSRRRFPAVIVQHSALLRLMTLWTVASPRARWHEPRIAAAEGVR